MCRVARETGGHLLVHCTFASDLWSSVLRSFALRLGERKRIEWNGKKFFFENILSFPLFGSLSRREWKEMKSSFPCLGV